MTWQISRASNVLMKNVIFYTLVITEIRKKMELKCSTSKLDLLMKILHVCKFRTEVIKLRIYKISENFQKKSKQLTI